MRRSLKQQAVGDRVRRLRTDRGLSLRGLAAATGFSPSFISQLEHGQVSPSIASMEKIALALEVTIGGFFAAAADADGGLVVKAGERARMSSSWSKAAVDALSPMGGRRRLDPVLITLEPGGRSGKHPYPHPREEFAYVLEGVVTLTLGPEEHRLRRGDSATILPGELRLWENRGRNVARVLLVSTRFPP
ncbi:MAG: hypothetical protein A2V74_06150 [Acidobacteria bacterium RBG_16_70_10]|nr:MAG: hypothetical protein A2V74_06150 [Acidobacteria bacterium RBG_16_70_10]